MLVMEVSIAHNLSAQIARTESVEMMPHACVKLGFQDPLAQRSHVTRNALQMEENATMETACALLELSVFNAKQRLTSALVVAAAMVCVMKQASNANATKALVEMIVAFKAVLAVAMSHTESALMERASVHQITAASIVAQRTATITALVMESVTVKPILAIASRDGLDMTAV
jgi:hypothetical protein